MRSTIQPGSRVLFVSTESETIRSFLLPFAAELRSEGVFVGAAARGAQECSPCRAAFDQVWHVNWTRSPLQILKLLASSRQIRRIVAIGGFQVVHVHTPIAAFVTRWALRHLRVSRQIRIIYTAHGFHFHEHGNAILNLVYLLFEKIAGRWTDYLIVINKEDRIAALRHHLVPASRVLYMPGIGIDLDCYLPSSEPRDSTAFRASVGVSPDRPLLLVIGDLIKRKRPLDAVEALALIENVDACLAYAGDGPLRGEIEKLAARRGLSGRVFLPGRLSDIRPAVLASSVVIHPSQQEGLPRAIMEAMAMGIPVICTDIRGSRQLVDENCGFLVPVGDVKSIANAVDHVLGDSRLAVELGSKGRERMSQFALSHILQMHQSLYGECLQGSRRAFMSVDGTKK